MHIIYIMCACICVCMFTYTHTYIGFFFPKQDWFTGIAYRDGVS